MVKSFARFSVFARGRIVGLSEGGASRPDILDKVRKRDGKRGGVRAIVAILAHARDDPEYEGGTVRPAADRVICRQLRKLACANSWKGR